MSNLINRIAVYSAIVGGVTLSVLIALTCMSIVGRALIPFGLRPVPGDYEIVEAGIAFAIFCFIPYCQARAGHATVDVFTSGLGDQPNRVIAAFWEVIFAAVLVVIAWRLSQGLFSKFHNGETTMFLQFPIWWAYAACMVAASVGVVVGLWSAWDRVNAVFRGKDSRPIHMEAD